MASEDPYYNRRLRGTKVYNMRHKIVLSIMAAGGLIGVLFHFMPASQHLSKLFRERTSTESEFMQERKFRISHSLLSTSSDIREHVKATEDPPAV